MDVVWIGFLTGILCGGGPMRLMGEETVGDGGAEAVTWALSSLEQPGVEESHGVTYERWSGVEGSRVTRNGQRLKALGLPAIKGVAASLEIPASGGTAYLARARGYFVAPRDGRVRFVLSSDDHSELWVSPGEDPFSRNRMAWIAGEGVLGWTKPGETSRMASQWTAPLEVKVGRRYYFEIYHQQGEGSDHLSVQYRYEGEKLPAVLPGEWLRPWVGSPQDADDDGLPDVWQQETGLAGKEKSGADDDFDGDGVSNYLEYRAGTDPTDARPVSGKLLWEAWNGLFGTDVGDLVRSPRFAGRPDEARLVDGGSSPVLGAGYYGSRLSGYLVPAESGNYQLAVSGDDATELWLSDGESIHRKELVAFGNSRVPRGNWFVGPSQRTKVMPLEAGKAYYFEVLQKDAKPPGWSAIGWKKEGEKSFVEVAPAYLRSPGIPADDLNRDFLPDEWVAKSLAELPAEKRHRVVFTQHGDPDRDGLPNWLEARLDSSPFEKTQVRGGLVREWWLNLPSRSLAVTKERGVFLKRASMVEISRGGSSLAYTADWYASRLRGYVVAPVSGSYRFWVSGDDQAEFWLSTDGTKYRKKLAAGVMPESWQSPLTQVHTKRHDWDARRGQASVEVELRAGESYFIELLLKDSGGDDHVALAWQHREEGQGEWSERRVVEDECLLSYEGDDDDLDDDYLPDSWEKRYGLDATDNGLRDRVKQGEEGDFDGDGLNNRLEYLLGTNPASTDSDGDGVSDNEEVRVYGSNPAVKDASPPRVVSTLPVKTPVEGNLEWRSIPRVEGAYSNQLRGNSVWEFEVGEAGVYRVDLAGSAESSMKPVPSIPVSLRVNGILIGIGDLAGGVEATKLSFMTPWLAAGRHRVTLENHNFRVGVSLRVKSLELLAQTGEDANGNGLPDWLENYYRARNRLVGATGPVVTSPASLEGLSRFVENAAAVSGGRVFELQRTVGEGWHTNVELDPEGGTTRVELSFEGGAIQETVELSWAAIDLFDGVEHRLVRRGDAVRLTAHAPESGVESGNCRLLLNGEEIYAGPASAPWVHRFEESGIYEVEAQVAGAGGAMESRVVRFEVIGAELGEDFHVPSESGREWVPAELPAGVLLEWDEGLRLSEVTNRAERTLHASFGMTRGTTGKVVARLPDGGAILDTATIHGFFFASSTWTGDHRQVEVLADGTRVVRVGYVVDGVIPPDFYVWLQMYVADALFANGDAWLRLGAGDFDEYGYAQVEIYKSPGEGTPYVCHWIRPYGEGPEEEEEEWPLTATLEPEAVEEGP